ncbi:lipocalin family protein [Gramella lutea]|uniref:Lipocalin family protein n=1 Tax=Christiangramia lutea TaxID=1607951 RepID=A0A9X2A7Z1_9FLAO|nr:lipocalin family protein [Christiangramia lutea]MCH4821994.1 lipocalin family protein [Christiangramia lutea]
MKLNETFIFPVFILFISLLISCNRTKLPVEEEIPVQYSDANIQPKRLYGNWQLSVMLADTPVDLNADGEANTNLLLETDCFDDMRIEFFENATFFTENAQMSFSPGISSNQFECLSNRQDDGFWEIIRDDLILSVIIENVIYQETKRIRLTGNRFTFDVTEEESDMYVNDPGNTLVSDIQIIELEYSRED